MNTTAGPLIELELNSDKVVSNDVHGGNDGGQRRLQRNRANESNEERVSKRRREDCASNGLPNHRTLASTTPRTFQGSSCTQRPPETVRYERQLKRDGHDSTDEGRAPKRPIHNGQATSTAVEPISIREPLFTQSDRSQSDHSVAQLPSKPRKRRLKIYKKKRGSR